MTAGFDQPLYLLPFDHRDSFESGLFGWKEPLTAEQAARIVAAKQIIYDGFEAAVAGGIPKQFAGVLVDEQFGAEILHDAARKGYLTAMPVEKSGQEEFQFEYGADFANHIETFAPTFSKVLVRYNPEGDQAMNQRQAARLKRLSGYLRRTERKLMFELLVPAEQAELEELGQDQRRYDRSRRPQHMVDAIRQLQDAGIEPDIWKVEGLDNRQHCVDVVRAAQHGGRNHVGCIVLGRGADERQVEHWLMTAAAVQGFIGFAVGRTTFWDPLLAWRDQRSSRAGTVTEVARRYTKWCDTFRRGYDTRGTQRAAT